jgi:hypothetical protein
LYKFIGTNKAWKWEVDEDIAHITFAMGDVLGIADADLEQNNSKAYEYLAHLTANSVFAELLVADTALIDEIVSSSAFITELTSSSAFINELASNTVFTAAIKASEGFFDNITISGYLNNVSGKYNGTLEVYPDADPDSPTGYKFSVNTNGIGLSTRTYISREVYDTGVYFIDSWHFKIWPRDISRPIGYEAYTPTGSSTDFENDLRISIQNTYVDRLFRLERPKHSLNNDIPIRGYLKFNDSSGNPIDITLTHLEIIYQNGSYLDNTFMFWGYSDAGTIYRVCFMDDERFYQYREPGAQFPIAKNRISWLVKMCFWTN